MRRTVIGLVVLLGLGAPVIALAATSGQQSLQLEVGLTPSKAGAPGVALHILITYKDPKNPGQQPPYNGNALTFKMPKGFQIDNGARARCKESAVVAAKGNATVCPAKSKVGSGTAVINARPTVKKLISATVTAYNGVNDTGSAGYPKGSGDLILYFKTSINVNRSIYDHMATSKAGNPELVAKFVKPAKPGIRPGTFTIQHLDLTIPGTGSKPYVSNPPSCSGTWPFSFKITNYFGQPSVAASDKVKCTK